MGTITFTEDGKIAKTQVKKLVKKAVVVNKERGDPTKIH
jgi:hypothetical protein